MRFLGNSEAKTDAKGRVFFPAVFRKQLQTAAEECLILRKDTYQDCLVLYPESVWNEQMNELRSKLNRWNSKHQMIFRQFVSDVEIITLDGNGRFLIPKRYLKLADIRQEVRFIGMDDTIEIWAKEIADKPFIAPEDFGKEHFNYIIIDCAPIGAAIDAAVVAKYCDGAIIVIGQGMASARMIQSVKKQLEASGVRILGAVLNKVNNKKNSHVSGYYGNYYGSYYGRSDKA